MKSSFGGDPNLKNEIVSALTVQLRLHDRRALSFRHAPTLPATGALLFDIVSALRPRHVNLVEIPGALAGNDERLKDVMRINAAMRTRT